MRWLTFVFLGVALLILAVSCDDSASRDELSKNSVTPYIVPESEAVNFLSVTLPNGELVVPLSSDPRYYEDDNTLAWRDTRQRSFVIYYTAPPFQLKPGEGPNNLWQQLDAQLNHAVPTGYLCAKYFAILVKGEGEMSLTVIPSFSPPSLTSAGLTYVPYGKSGDEWNYKLVQSKNADMLIIVYNTPCVMHFMFTDWYDIRWGHPEDRNQFLDRLSRHKIDFDVVYVLVEWWMKTSLLSIDK